MSRIIKEMDTFISHVKELEVLDKKTMKNIEDTIFPSLKMFTSSQIKKIRENAKVSQAVFAKFLNVATSTVSQWEQGKKHPTGASLKLLNVINNHGIETLA